MKNILEIEEFNNGGKLKIYSSGNGSLSFVFCDHSGKASGGQPSLECAKFYVQNFRPELSSFKIAKKNDQILLYEPFEIDDDESLAFKDHVKYRFSYDHNKKRLLDLKYKDFYDDTWHECKNLNTRASLEFYLVNFHYATE